MTVLNVKTHPTGPVTTRNAKPASHWHALGKPPLQLLSQLALGESEIPDGIKPREDKRVVRV